MTLAPCSASISAYSRPIPRPAPVTMATRPSHIPGMACPPSVRSSSRFVSTSVAAAANIPPTPCVTLTVTSGTWAGALPRSCRTDSWMANMPYIPVWVYESPPPFVFIGSGPPGAVLPAAMNAPASPRGTKPRSSSP